jgi:1,4-dihydroxy-2-naphthoate octaprenyltransferase
LAWWEYCFLVSAAFLTVIILVSAGRLAFTSLIVLLALPQAIIALRILRKGRSRQELAGGVPATSRLHLYFGLLLTIGVLLGHFVR